MNKGHRQSSDRFDSGVSGCSCLAQYGLGLLPPLPIAHGALAHRRKDHQSKSYHHHLVQTFVSFIALIPSHPLKELCFGLAL